MLPDALLEQVSGSIWAIGVYRQNNLVTKAPAPRLSSACQTQK